MNGPSDVVDETGGDGIYTVQSSVTFSLADPAHAKGAIENLTLLGAAPVNGTGDGLANILIGNLGANFLAGDAGDDMLNAGPGNDSLDGGEGTDTSTTAAILTAASFVYAGGRWVTVGDGIDTLANIERVTDGAGTDFLLVGGGGYETVAAAEAVAGLGDIIISVAVDDGDVGANSVVENAAVGTPVGLTAEAIALEGAISYSLTDDAGGRFAIDQITGVVAVANGTLLDFESAASPLVTVKATDIQGVFSEQSFLIEVTDVPGATIRGGARLKGTSEDDRLIGNRAKNVFTGGDGDDQFVFTTKPTRGSVDRITDFSHADDTILLESHMFRGLHPGPLRSWAFEKNGRGLADDARDRIIHNHRTGDLLYDRDGSRDHYRPVKFADLDRSPNDVSHADFFVI